MLHGHSKRYLGSFPQDFDKLVYFASCDIELYWKILCGIFPQFILNVVEWAIKFSIFACPGVLERLTWVLVGLRPAFMAVKSFYK